MTSFLSIVLSYLSFFLFLLKKQRREVSINRPASYEPAALPLRHPAFYTTTNHILLYLTPILIPLEKKAPSPGIEPGAQT